MSNIASHVLLVNWLLSPWNSNLPLIILNKMISKGKSRGLKIWGLFSEITDVWISHRKFCNRLKSSTFELNWYQLTIGLNNYPLRSHEILLNFMMMLGFLRNVKIEDKFRTKIISGMRGLLSKIHFLPLFLKPGILSFYFLHDIRTIIGLSFYIMEKSQFSW